MHDPDLGGLGVCIDCGLDVADAFAKLDEEPRLTQRQANRQLRERNRELARRDQAESNAMAPGWIYYLRIDQRIKIGYSVDVKRRMRAYPPHAVLLAVHPGTPTIEREMHARFDSIRVAGREWFHPGDELLTHIREVVAQFGEPDARHVYRFRTGPTVKG